MARKSSRKSAARPAPKAAKTERDLSAREKVVEAFLGLLAEKPIEQIGFAEIATSADVSLADLRDMFGSKIAILAAYMKEIDRAVLAGASADMADEPPRERLFDVLMRRLDALAPHKAAVRSLARSAMRNPGLAFALNGLAVRSQQWMLTAADIGASGPKGMMRAQGLAMLFASVCAPGRMTMKRDWPAPWRRSTARWRAGRSGRACSTAYAASRPAPAACARGGGPAATPTTRRSRLKRSSSSRRFTSPLEAEVGGSTRSEEQPGAGSP